MAKWIEIAIDQFCVQPEIFEISIPFFFFFQYEKCKTLESLPMFYFVIWKPKGE